MFSAGESAGKLGDSHQCVVERSDELSATLSGDRYLVPETCTGNVLLRFLADESIFMTVQEALPDVFPAVELQVRLSQAFIQQFLVPVRFSWGSVEA